MLARIFHIQNVRQTSQSAVWSLDIFTRTHEVVTVLIPEGCWEDGHWTAVVQLGVAEFRAEAQNNEYELGY